MLIVKLFVDIEMFAMYNFIQKEGDTLSLGERIRKVRRTLDLTQEAFCNRIGLKRNSISLVESDKRNISDQAILSICREFNVNEEWLRNGNGEMFKAAPADVLDQLAYKYHLSEADYVMVEKFVTMRPEARKVLFDYIHEVSAAFANFDIDPCALAYRNKPPLQMDEIINIQRESIGTPDSVAAAEAAYEKSLGIVPKKDCTALNITEDANGNEVVS